MRLGGLNAKLNSALASIVATKGSQNINAQLIFFYTIYNNYNHKLLTRVKKPAIPWNKFRGWALKGDLKVSQEKRKKK